MILAILAVLMLLGRGGRGGGFWGFLSGMMLGNLWARRRGGGWGGGGFGGGDSGGGGLAALAAGIRAAAEPPATGDETMEQRLKELVSKLTDALGDRLVSVMLYGSAAVGDHHANFSDLNVLCVLSQVIPPSWANATRSCAGGARRGIRRRC